MTALERRTGLRGGVLLALGTVYLVWGSTYLAIRLAIETLPPLSMAGARFLLAGLALLAWAVATGAPRPRREHWVPAAGIGALLLLGANGAVVWAEQRVESGVAALVVAIEPVAVALLAPVILGHRRAGRRVVAGLAAGVLGVAFLVVDPRGLDPTSVDPLGVAVLVLGATSWAVGSLWSVRAALPASRAMTAALHMLFGGAFLLIAGGISGEWTPGALGAASRSSILAFGYLVVFGSIVAFSAYSYLLRAAPPTVAATYAFVNPIVAVLLGWLVAAEPVTWRIGVALVLILAAVALLITEGGRESKERDRDAVRSGPVAATPLPEACVAEVGTRATTCS